MSHHAADRLYRHTEREGDVGPEIMPGLMVGQIKAIYLSQLSCQCYKISTIVNIEYLVPGSLATIFLDDLKGNIQQADRRKRIRLLPVDVNPPCAVLSLRDIIDRQFFQVRIRQSGKCRENEHIPYELQLRLLHRGGHQCLQVLQFHVPAFSFWQFGMQAAVRVTAQCPLADRPHCQLLQAVQVFMYGLGFLVAVRAQEQLEVVIKRTVKASQCHVLHAFLLLNKSGKVLVGTLVGVVCFLYAVYPDTLLELLVMLPEQGKQGKWFLPDAFDCILDKFRCNEPQTVLYPVVMSGYLVCQVIYGAVHRNCIFTPSVGASFVGIPNRGIDGYFGSYLCPFGIDAYLAQ